MKMIHNNNDIFFTKSSTKDAQRRPMQLFNENDPTSRKKARLKLKKPKAFSGEGDDSIVLKEEFKRFKRDVTNNQEKKMY